VRYVSADHKFFALCARYHKKDSGLIVTVTNGSTEYEVSRNRVTVRFIGTPHEGEENHLNPLELKRVYLSGVFAAFSMSQLC
jgi:hypothetical protein